MPCSALRLIALWPSCRARSSRAVISCPPRPPPRRLGTTAIVSSGVSLVDEAEAGRARREEPVPRGADRPGLPGHEAGIAGPAPVVDVPGDREVGIRVQPPVIGVLQHVAEETNVLWPGLADHDR